MIERKREIEREREREPPGPQTRFNEPSFQPFSEGQQLLMSVPKYVRQKLPRL